MQNIAKKSLQKTKIVLIGFLLTLCLAACPGPGENDTNQSTPNGTTKAILKIQNNTPYTVNVYINDPPLYSQAQSTIRTVQKGLSTMWELMPSAENSNGDTLYFEYLIPIGSAVVPYYASNPDNIKIKKLIAGQINTQDVPPLGAAATTSSFVLIRNDSADTIWLQQGDYTRNPFGASTRDIAPGSTNAVFVFDNISSLNGFTLGAFARKNLPSVNIEQGKVYTFVYDGVNNPGLFLVQPFNPNMGQNIWTIPTRTDTGKFFNVGLLRARANVVNDGYIVTGKVNYSLDTLVNPQVGSIPYLGLIAPNGSMSLEKRVTIRNGPSSINFRDFIDNTANNEMVFAGQAYYDDMEGIPYILSTDRNGEVNYYYEEFAGNEYLYGYKLAPFGTSGYALGYDFYEGGWKTGISKVSKTGFDTVTHRDFWRSPLGVDFQTWGSLQYDQTHNMFIVAAHDNQATGYDLNSKLFFIDASGDTGTEKFPAISLPRYGIGHFSMIGQDFYIIGTYDSDSKYRGIIEKIDLSTGARSGNPHLIDSKFVNGTASIEGFVLENDGNIVIAGWCKKNNTSTKYIPWLVKYNLTTRTKIWEEAYENFEGQYIYSVHHNAIGSYLLELYDDETYQGHLVSTDLMGRIKDDSGAIINELEAIPRNFEYSAMRPGEPGISVTIAPVPADLALSSPQAVTVTKGQNAVITLNGTWASYAWYVNGSPVPGAAATYTFTTAARNAGVYTVTAVVTSGEAELFSASCRVTVNN